MRGPLSYYGKSRAATPKGPCFVLSICGFIRPGWRLYFALRTTVLEDVLPGTEDTDP